MPELKTDRVTLGDEDCNGRPLTAPITATSSMATTTISNVV